MSETDKVFAGSVPEIRPLFGTVDFRVVRRGHCTTRSVLVAKRRFGDRRGQRGCHPRPGVKTAPGRAEPPDGAVAE
jgi:hypothetical protein